MKKDPIMEFFNLGVDFTPLIIKTSKDPSLKPSNFLKNLIPSCDWSRINNFR